MFGKRCPARVLGPGLSVVAFSVGVVAEQSWDGGGRPFMLGLVEEVGGQARELATASLLASTPNANPSATRPRKREVPPGGDDQHAARTLGDQLRLDLGPAPPDTG
jgi:hypothetical protein